MHALTAGLAAELSAAAETREEIGI